MARDTREGLFVGIAVVAIAALPLLGLFGYLSVRLGEDFFIPTMIAGTIAATVILRGPVGRALARRIEGDAPASPEFLGEVDDLRQRVLEMEERLDFAERMIARPKEDERIIQ